MVVVGEERRLLLHGPFAGAPSALCRRCQWDSRPFRGDPSPGARDGWLLPGVSRHIGRPPCSRRAAFQDAPRCSLLHCMRPPRLGRRRRSRWQSGPEEDPINRFRSPRFGLKWRFGCVLFFRPVFVAALLHPPVYCLRFVCDCLLACRPGRTVAVGALFPMRTSSVPLVPLLFLPSFSVFRPSVLFLFFLFRAR